MEFVQWRDSIKTEMDSMYAVLQTQPARPHDTYELLLKCSAYVSRLAEIYASPTGNNACHFVAKKYNDIVARMGGVPKAYSVEKELKHTEEYIFAEAIKYRLLGVKKICSSLESLLADDARLKS